MSSASSEVPPPSEQTAAMIGSYFYESRRPLVSLVFVTPLLAIYELGVLWLGPNAMRNGAEVWLRTLLDGIGLGQYFLLPALTVGLLLAWHHASRQPWRVPSWVFGGMTSECLSLALLLVVIALVQGALGSWFAPAETPAVAALPTPLASGLTDTVQRAISFFGAGIYEEVLFRLMLLPGLIVLLRLLGASAGQCVWGAIALSSLLFSAAHYVGPQGDIFNWFSFTFRFLAGGFFAMVFVYRGFGIAAGTHALYDIYVGLV
jgi:membrane protease YdiL (CAAX protease family)